MKILDWCLGILYPQTCCFCGKVSTEPICKECREQVYYVKEPRCKKCGKPVRYKEQEFCLDCSRKQLHYEAGRSVWIHKGLVPWSIYQFKYHNRRIYGEYYAEEMYRLYGNKIREWEIDAIVPVPLHWKRKLSRGYNQAEIVAKALGRKTGIPVESKMVVRTKNTKPQKKLAHRERSVNLKNAFCAKRVKKGIQNILIIDDIYTTGNTINEMAKCLYSKGIQKVFFLTISIGQGS